MNKHTIKLSARQKHHLKNITAKGKHNARVIKRAQILLASHHGSKDAEIAAQIGITIRTVERVRKRYYMNGLKAALYDALRPGAKRKLTDKAEARLVAIACSDPPQAYDHWTLELMRQELLTERLVESVSTVTLWNYLDEKGIKPWREKNVVYPEPYTGIHRADGRYLKSVR